MSKLDQLPADFIETFSRHLKYVKFIGIDIFDEPQSRFIKRFARLILFYFIIVSTFIGQFLFFSLNHKIGTEFLDIVNAIPGTMLVIQDIVKMTILTIKRNDIRKVIIEIAELWPINSSGQNKTLKTWTTRLQLFQRFYYTCGYVALAFYLLVPLAVTMYMYIVESRVVYRFPLESYFFLFLSSHYAYAIAYVYIAFVTTSIYLCIYIASDFILTSLTFDVSGLLATLQDELNHLSHEEFPKRGDCSDVKAIVESHQKLLRVVKKLNNIFGPLLFTQVTFTSMVICCFGFLTVVGKDMIKNLLATFGIILAMFNFCWSGQLLSDASTDMAEAAYRCIWYKRSNKFRKYTQIIIARAQKPCVLSALGFSNVTLVTLSKILSTSWSYLSLLNQMYNDIDVDSKK